MDESAEHLGCDQHDPAGAGSGNIRNRTGPKTVLIEASGRTDIDASRDRPARSNISRITDKVVSGCEQQPMSGRRVGPYVIVAARHAGIA